MWRRVRLVVVMLLFGTVINFALAWAATALGGFPGGRYYEHSVGAITYRVVSAAAFGRELVTVNGGTSPGIGASPYPGRVWWLAAGVDQEASAWTMTGAGWPMFALATLQSPGPAGSAWVVRHGLLFRHKDEYALLPTQPLWLGFVVNTLLYAAALPVLLYGPGFVCRRIRTWRGRCSNCGYPRGDSSICSECGATVKPLAATAPTHSSPP